MTVTPTPKMILYLIFIFFFVKTNFYLFIFGCAGSLLLHMGFSSCREQGLLFITVPGLLISVAALGVEHRL